jgi:hypothetical protein
MIFICNFFKDRLITEPLSGKNSRVLPSPEDLKYKVLIRVSIAFSCNFYSIVVH